MSVLKNKALAWLILWFLFVGNVSAATIDKIEAIDNNTIEVTASEDIVFSDVNVEGDVKLLKDIPVSFSALDVENTKKVLINLWDHLMAETSYSLISILWAEGNIDFTIGQYLEWEISNDNIDSEDKWIQKINIVDSRTIELFFTYWLEDDTFEFKILSEIQTDWLNSEWNNKLSLDVTRALQNSTSYIFMILTLEDINGDEINFDEDLLDFVTSDDLSEEIPEEVAQIAQTEKEPEVVEEWNMEEIPLNSAAIPETWAAAWILVLFAVLINIAIFARKKFSK